MFPGLRANRRADPGRAAVRPTSGAIPQEPADVIFNDYRSNAPFYRIDQLMEIPTFATLPAVKAGQIDYWYYEWGLSHRGFAFVLENLASSVCGARADIV